MTYTATIKSFVLKYTQTNGTVTVNRNSSPSGMGSIGNLSNSSTIYGGDTLTISYSPSSSTGYSYTLSSFTINGINYTSAQNITVSDNITINLNYNRDYAKPTSLSAPTISKEISYDRIEVDV